MKKSKKEISQNINIIQIPHYIPILIFISTTTIFFWGQLSGNSFFWEDFVEYVYPVQTFAARESNTGSIPFWNPYIFSGMPFISDIQTGFFYPLNRLLNLFIDKEGHLSIWGLQFVTIIHFLISQITFYFLILHYKRTQFAAIISSIAYSFSAIMVLHVIHPMMIYHLAWLPLVFLFFDKGIKESNFRYGIISGLILGISLLSGHPQTGLYIFTFLFLYFIWILIFKWIENKLSIKELVINKIPPILTFIISIGIFCIQFLPSQELAKNSLRAESNYEKSAEGSLQAKQVFSAVIPNLFGKILPTEQNDFAFYLTDSNKNPLPYYYYWETSFYFGVIILILGLIAIISDFRNRTNLFLLFIIILSFLYALGDNFFLHKLIYNFPFFNIFRMPSRILIFAIFAFCILSAYGFDKLVKREINFKIVIYSLIIPLLISILGFTGFLNSILDLQSQYLSKVSSTSLFILFIILIFGILSYFKIHYKLSYLTVGVIFTLITFFDLYLAHKDFNSSNQNISDLYQIETNLKQAFIPNDINELFRVNTRTFNPPFMATKRNQGIIDKFQNTEGYNPLVLARINPPLKTNEEIFNLLNVKYELRFDNIKKQPYFYENVNRLPRAWMVYDYIVSDSTKIKDLMMNTEIDYRKTVVLEDDPKINISKIKDTIFTTNAIIREYRNNYIRIEIVDNSKDGILVLSEIWYPAWKVSVDGIPTKLLKANYSLRGVVVPKGKSIVELRFASESFAIGQWITILTLIISVPLLFIGKFNKNYNNEK